MLAKKLYRMSVLFLLMVVGIISNSAHATSCTTTSPSFNFPSPLTINNTVQSGALLTPWVQTTMAISCVKDSVWYEWLLSNRISAPANLTLTSFTVSDGGVVYKVFDTKTPGIGIAIGFISTDAGRAWQTLTASPQSTAMAVPADNVLGSIDMYNGSPGSPVKYAATGTFKAALVKIGDRRIGSAALPAMAAVSYYPIWYGRRNKSDPMEYTADSLTASVSVASINLVSTAPSCTVTSATANQTVSLGDVSAAKFKGVGTAAGQASFNINLQSCYNYPVVSLTLSGAVDGNLANAAQNGVLATQGSATGVGLQILDNRNSSSPNPVPLNASWAAGTVTGSGQADTMTLPFAARFIQTRPAIGPGNATATATIQFTYQ